MSRVDIQGLATELLAALDGNHTIEPITARHPHFDAADAYRVSAEILRRRRARGEKPVGRKIGFTNRGIWAEYGVSAPMWAHVYDSTVTWVEGASARLAIASLAQPRIEPEIVLHFARAPRAHADEVELLASVDWIAHGFEIVQTHFPNWIFRLPDTIADFGLHGALVVGPKRPLIGAGDVAHKLRTFRVTLERNGNVQAQGAGTNVLGGPVLAAMHLLHVLQDQREFEAVEAGEIVTTGTLTSACPIGAGETWSTELCGIDLPGLRLDVVA